MFAVDVVGLLLANLYSSDYVLVVVMPSVELFLKPAIPVVAVRIHCSLRSPASALIRNDLPVPAVPVIIMGSGCEGKLLLKFFAGEQCYMQGVVFGLMLSNPQVVFPLDTYYQPLLFHFVLL